MIYLYRLKIDKGDSDMMIKIYTIFSFIGLGMMHLLVILAPFIFYWREYLLLFDLKWKIGVVTVVLLFIMTYFLYKSDFFNNALTIEMSREKFLRLKKYLIIYFVILLVLLLTSPFLLLVLMPNR